MDEFGQRLSDDAIKGLFLERPPLENEALCDLFDLKMSLFEKHFKPEVCQVELDAVAINREYQEKFYEYDPEDTKKRLLAQYESKLTEEELEEFRKILKEPPPEKEVTPRSYTSNNPDEDKLVSLAKTFQNQYRYLFPDGSRNILCLPNEHGVLKLVSTTLCPYFCTQLKLRSWERSAAFVADFLNYESLTAPPISPEVLVSPELTMKRRRGNSLDFSMVLCSFLISTGYDAYVVQGYATKLVCVRDLSRTTCPELHWSTKSQRIKVLGTLQASEDTKEKPVSKYHVSKVDLNVEKKSSKYLNMAEEIKQNLIVSEAAKKSLAEKEELKQLNIRSDPFYGKRVHFWVLLKRGQRNISDTFFLEPSTGDRINTSCSEYMGIEFVWNHHNFWVNKQRHVESCEDIDFNLDDIEKWDYFLPISSCGESLLPDSERLSSVPMPSSWVRCYDVTSKELRQPLPEGNKIMKYYKATLEKFNEFVLKDGCIVRKTIYSDEDCQTVCETQELFRNRNDLLMVRQSNLVDGTVREIFDEARNDSLKEYVHNLLNPEPKTVMLFYPGIRTDGLVKRSYTEEHVENEYIDRKDFLVMRTEKYLVPFKKPIFIENKPPIEELPKAVKKQEHLLTPYSFEELVPILTNVNFSEWHFEQFLDEISPEYQYFPDPEIEGADEKMDDVESAEIDESTLNEDNLENDYKIWLHGLREELETLKESRCTPIYEDLTESKESLQLKKKFLNKKIRDRKVKKLITDDEEENQSDSKADQITMLSKISKMNTTSASEANEDFADKSNLNCLVDSLDEENNEYLKNKRKIFAAIFDRKTQYRMQCGKPGSKLILDISKIYRRNQSLPPEKDVRRRRYIIDEGRYISEFFPAEDRISPKSIIFIKPEVKCEYFIERFDFSDALYKIIEPGYETAHLSQLFIYKKLLRLIQNESKSLSECEETIKELESFSSMMDCERQNLKLVPEPSNLDMRDEIKVMKEQKYKEAVLAACKKKEVEDYLSPAFAEVGYNLPLDECRAKQAYNYMIKDYTDRAKRRYSEMEKKFRKTLEEHNLRLEAYNKMGRDKITSEQLKSLEEKCKKVDTILSVLLMRGERFRQVTRERYDTLKENLMTDPRLEAFTKTIQNSKVS